MAVVAVVAIAGAAFAFISRDSEPDCCAPAPQQQEQVKKAVDGKLEFTLGAVECAKEKIGDDTVFAEAKGGFCLVSVEVKNNGTEELRLYSSDQFIVTGDGEKIAVDTDAQFYVENGGWYDNLEAGKTASGKLVWDIPVGASVDKFEFHAESDSAGAVIER